MKIEKSHCQDDHFKLFKMPLFHNFHITRNIDREFEFSEFM